jgi:hypothetical protein
MALVAALLAILAWHLTAYHRGRLMGSLDHACGHFEVKVFGGPPLPPQELECYSVYARLLKERYGVELNVIGGCVVSEAEGRYAEGYSDVSRSLLKKKYGRDIFAECWTLAQQHGQAEHSRP